MSQPLNAQAYRPMQGGPSFSLGNRALRAVWTMAWFVLCRFTPPQLHGWRRLVLRVFGASVAQGARIHASAMVWLPANLELGENCLIGPRVRLYNQGRISIGAGAVVSQGAHICASSHDLRDPHFQLVLRPVRIAAECWIAAEAFVGPGVTMHERAVLAARGALFGDAQADTVYRGNPAIAIKPRGLQTNQEQAD